MRILFSANVLLLSLLASSSAHAWGAEGHRLIGEMAEAQLTPTARTEVTRLLAAEPGATMQSVSTWADEIRSRDTASWHYVNPPPGDCCLTLSPSNGMRKEPKIKVRSMGDRDYYQVADMHKTIRS